MLGRYTGILILLVLTAVPAAGQNRPEVRVAVGPTGTILLPSPTGAGGHATVSAAWATGVQPLRLRMETFVNVDPASSRGGVLGLSPGLQLEATAGILRPYGFGGVGLYAGGRHGTGGLSLNPGFNAGVGLAVGRTGRAYFAEAGAHHYGSRWGDAGASPTLWSLSLGLQL